MPPSMVMFSPVMKPALSEQRNRIISAMSRGVPTRPTGCCRASAPLIFPSAVSIQPGEMLFTRTRPERLTASAWVRALMPPLAAV